MQSHIHNLLLITHVTPTTPRASLHLFLLQRRETKSNPIYIYIYIFFALSLWRKICGRWLGFRPNSSGIYKSPCELNIIFSRHLPYITLLASLQICHFLFLHCLLAFSLSLTINAHYSLFVQFSPFLSPYYWLNTNMSGFARTSVSLMPH